jgi:glucose-1-phosphate cytidylyltransferase
MKTVLLAGGLGTRLKEETEVKPKPMVMVGNYPILWHIMKFYAENNFRDFVICAGFKGEVIQEYFKNFQDLNTDLTIKTGENFSMERHNVVQEDWQVTISNTGKDTPTGGRLFKIQKYLNGERFLCTYGDGVSNVNLNELLRFHIKHGKIATLTAVRPPSRFGQLKIGRNDFVDRFEEKPEGENWVNGGFFVFEPEIFKFIELNSVLEDDVLTNLAKVGELKAFKHYDFWQPMDTYREFTILNQMWDQEKAPWKIWK